MRPRHRSRPKRRRRRSRAVSRWISRSRSSASWPMPPGALRSASRRSGQVGDRLLEALRDGREVLLVAGDQRRVGLGREPVGKVKRAGSQGIHRSAPGRLVRLAASSSSVAATAAPSVRIRPATAAARARVCGARAVLSAADRDSVVGGRNVVGHADAQAGHPAGPVRLVRPLGHHHLRRAGPGGGGRGARAAVVHDGGHPAEQGLLVDLADGEAVVPASSTGARPAQPRPTSGAAALRADRLDGHPGDVLRGAHAAEARRTPAAGRRPGTPPDRPGAGARRAGSTRRSARRRDRPVPATGPAPGRPPATGWSPTMKSRTLPTGGRPVDARWALSAGPYSAL